MTLEEKQELKYGDIIVFSCYAKYNIDDRMIGMVLYNNGSFIEVTWKAISVDTPCRVFIQYSDFEKAHVAKLFDAKQNPNYKSPMYKDRAWVWNNNQLKIDTEAQEDVAVSETITDTENNVPKQVDDPVNHPTHYTNGKYECLDVMEDVFGREAVMNFCLLNTFKYVWRHSKKNGKEDLEKAAFYLNRAIGMYGEDSRV